MRAEADIKGLSFKVSFYFAQQISMRARVYACGRRHASQSVQ